MTNEFKVIFGIIFFSSLIWEIDKPNLYITCSCALCNREKWICAKLFFAAQKRKKKKKKEIDKIEMLVQPNNLRIRMNFLIFCVGCFYMFDDMHAKCYMNHSNHLVDCIRSNKLIVRMVVCVILQILSTIRSIFGIERMIFFGRPWTCTLNRKCARNSWPHCLSLSVSLSHLFYLIIYLSVMWLYITSLSVSGRFCWHSTTLNIFRIRICIFKTETQHKRQKKNIRLPI